MNRSLVIFYICIVLVVIFRLFIFYANQKTYSKGDFVEFSTQISTSPKNYVYYQTIYINIDRINKVLVKTDLDKQFNYGDRVRISGNLDTRLLNDGTRIFILNYPKVEANLHQDNILLAVTFFIRQKIIDNFNKTLDPISSSLLSGIVLGAKEGMPKAFLSDAQITGVMHVVAASGMNVTIISGVFFYLLSSIFKRQLAITFSIFGILFYTAIAGFEPSIIRAAIMGIIVFSAQILGRQQFSLNILLMTGFIMLFVWPEFLFETGFQLSFAATAGILFIPKVFKKIQNNFTEVFITTTSAQIATLPILLTNFGNFSPWSVLVNALVLWTVPILMILGGISAMFTFIFMPISKILLYLCIPFLYFFEKVVSFFAGFGSAFTFENIPWQLSVGYYLVLISLLLSLNKRK